MNSMKNIENIENIENTDLYNEIFLTVNKKVQNFHTAEEITQEVFMDLAKKNIDTTRNMRGYLYFVSRAKIADRYRDHENDSKLSIQGLDFPTPESPDYVVIDELLALLSSQERAVVDCKQLTDIGGAKELGISVDLFRVTKYRARQKIEKYLEI